MRREKNHTTNQMKKLTKIIVILLIAKLTCPAHTQQIIPDGFSSEWLNLEFNLAIGLTFDGEGRMYVWEKAGKIWLVEDEIKSVEPLLDISDEVGDFGDCGLLGVALDPDYLDNGYIYLCYSVDYYHLKFSEEPWYDPTESLNDKASISRCTRYTVDFSNSKLSIDKSTRKILFGENIGEGAAIIQKVHSGCGIDFGDDGSLIISTGDGSSWVGPYYGGFAPAENMGEVEQALEDGMITAEEEVGQLRSQQLESLCGKILRIDPETGLGLPSNPFYDPSNPGSNKSKVWSLGFRNPYNLKVRKGSGVSDPNLGVPGVIYTGDVGSGLWEELIIIRQSGLNYGWPIFEGCDPNYEYEGERRVNKYAPNPLYGIDGCDEPYFIFKDLVPQATLNEVDYSNPCDPSEEIPEEFLSKHTRPDLNLAHQPAGLGVYYGAFDNNGNSINQLITHPDSPIEGEMDDLRSQAIVGGDFYTGNAFPEKYHNKFFFADYNQGWVSMLSYDLNDSIESVEAFFQDTFKLVHVEANELDGCLYLVNFNEGISRICYGNNLAPQVVLAYDKNFGASPLEVNFIGEDSYDPQGEDLSFFWEFGDGETSIEKNPNHNFTSLNEEITNYTVNLTVTDEFGLTASASQLISINNTPPQVDIVSIADDQLYDMTGINEILLKANVEDLEHDYDELNYEWTWKLHHNSHVHPEPVITDQESTVFLEPAGCGSEIFYYGAELKVTDSDGLIGEDNVFLYPDCESKAVDLLSFKASFDNEERKVVCTWGVVNETKIVEYQIERANINKIFTLAGALSASGNNLEEVQYEINDLTPFTGLQFYRLVMISEDGSKTYSSERLVFVIEEEEIFVYPNPATNNVLFLIGSLKGEAKIEIYNGRGKLVRRFIETGSGQQTKRIDLNGLVSGTYSYKVVNGRKITTGRIIKI